MFFVDGIGIFLARGVSSLPRALHGDQCVVRWMDRFLRGKKPALFVHRQLLVDQCCVFGLCRVFFMRDASVVWCVLQRFERFALPNVFGTEFVRLPKGVDGVKALVEICLVEFFVEGAR